MQSLVLSFADVEASQLMLVGGKALNLGRLAGIEGIQVPDGFCVTTAGYRQAVEENGLYQALLEQLNILSADDRKQIAEISAKIRSHILAAGIPGDVAAAVTHHVSTLGRSMLMLSVPVQLLKICHMPPLPDSRTLI